MGTICASQGVITISNPTKSRYTLSHKLEMGSPTCIEPCESFYSYYTLNAAPLEISPASELWICVKISNKKKRLVKIIPKSSLPSYIISEQKVQKTFEKFKKVKSKFFLKLYKVYENRDGYYVVIEYLPNGSLDDMIEEFEINERKVVGIVTQLLNIGNLLDDLGAKLYDLTPKKLFLFEGSRFEVKFNTFSVRNILKEGLENSCFRCPEAGIKKMNEKNVVWSIGMITSYLITSKEIQELDRQLEDMEEDTKDFIKRTLNKDPNLRISIKNALNHPWILNNS